MLKWKIALRYLFSKKSHGVVNIISLISVIGVAVATMAITIVMSIFNGFTRLAASQLSALDPQIQVVPVEGKVIEDADSILADIIRLPYVDTAVQVVEERALLMAGNLQMPVVMKGVPEGYDKFCGIDSVLVDGQYLDDIGDMGMAQIGSGVAMKTGVRANYNNEISLYVPRRVGRINPANPAASFMATELMVSGVFQIGQSEYDYDHIFLNIDRARELLQYTTESTAIEIKLTDGASETSAVKEISTLVGSGFKVLTRLQQQEEAFRMIEIEKWVTFLMLAFILIIASFNIISTLSLLVIEKRANMETMRDLGAPKKMVRGIFIIQGWLISVCGGVIGIIIGTLLSLAQQHFGFIRLSGDPANLTVEAYPVHVVPLDLLMVFGLVILVGFL
ncbi:MAG: ABC transporter permease, partial [Muribaculaceae bacterium]|nr:ABC transporter permease [Muribaculaceae bacterium]